MMRHSSAFSMLELLLAMTISAFVIMGMMQGLATVHRFIKRAQEMMSINRRACLTFNQLERDCNAAIIPQLAKTEEEITEEKKEVEAHTKEKDYYECFKGMMYEDAGWRLAGKKHELFKSLSMICTNPLKVYNERRPNLVRVSYELLPDKEKKKGIKIPYKLIRKETLDLKNKNFKDKDNLSKKETHLAVRTHIIADYIKEFSIEYVVPKPIEKGKTPDSDDIEQKSFVWGKKEVVAPHEQKKDESLALLPQYVNFCLVFYTDDLEDTYSFETMCQVLSYGSPMQSQPKREELKRDEIKQEAPKPVDVAKSGEIATPIQKVKAEEVKSVIVGKPEEVKFILPPGFPTFQEMIAALAELGIQIAT